MSTTTIRQQNPLFPLGQTVATPGALAALAELGMTGFELLYRHHRGDWGDLDQEDIATNNAALKDGARLFSSYQLTQQIKIWIITEADRSVTTLLLPEEY
ncbi:hypothetical protein A1353_08415 [Methylomonas methanica]|uniref:Type I restriction endonuclease subunit M n=1 Tax=Methylomonas methanica TaxID=421 RepID=A0A177MML3_METMH|nr:hypothetical protein [Methylomonas methanica]OAI07036.1 hypothetical protein A1353_08415 [Methylomonas methanica]